MPDDQPAREHDTTTVFWPRTILAKIVRSQSLGNRLQKKRSNVIPSSSSSILKNKTIEHMPRIAKKFGGVVAHRCLLCQSEPCRSSSSSNNNEHILSFVQVRVSSSAWKRLCVCVPLNGIRLLNFGNDLCLSVCLLFEESQMIDMRRLIDLWNVEYACLCRCEWLQIEEFCVTVCVCWKIDTANSMRESFERSSKCPRWKSIIATHDHQQ